MKNIRSPFRVFATIILILSFALISCSKKDETTDGSAGGQNKSSKVSSDETKDDPYEEFLVKLAENSLGTMLPSGTFGFVMFMNQNGIAKKQKEYWEKDLPKEVRDIVQQSMAGLEKILDEAGVLQGKTIDDVYEMESVQFLTTLQGIEGKAEVNADALPKADYAATGTPAESLEETGAGFIARFKLERLQDKAKDIAGSLSRSGYPATVIMKARLSGSADNVEEYALIEFSQDSSFLSGFRFLALYNEYVVFSSTPEVLDEIFSVRENKLPALFRDADFRKTAERLSFMKSAVVFGGLKGHPKMIQASLADSASAVQTDSQLMNSPIGALLNTAENQNADSSEKPLVLAFNQSFDSQYRAELRAPLSNDMSQMLNAMMTGASDQVGKVNQKIEALASIPGNGILFLEFSPESTRNIVSMAAPVLKGIEADSEVLLPLLKQFSIVMSATEGQQSFLPFPSIGFQFHFSDLSKALPLFEKLIEKQLQASGMVPPGASWVPDGEKGKSMLTAIGEQVVLLSQKGTDDSGTVAFSSSRDQAKYLLSGVSEDKGTVLDFADFMPNRDSSFGPPSSDGAVTDIVKLFINFRALNNALEKVFTMSAVFGQDPMKNTGGFDPQNLGKALAAIGASGIRLYVENTAANKEDPSQELVIKAQARKID